MNFISLELSGMRIFPVLSLILCHRCLEPVVACFMFHLLVSMCDLVF